MRLRLVDLDRSLTEQPVLQQAVRAGTAQLIDLSDRGDGMRLWASRGQMRHFAGRLAAAGTPPGTGPTVTFLGSGDYHHLSAALITEAEGPLTVLHFDNHPDWVRFPPAYHCGSWINRILDLQQVERVVTIGPCGSDLTRPQLKGGNLGALASGKLEIFPWRHAPSRVWGRIGSGAGHRQDDGHLVWRNVGGPAWTGFIDDLLARLPTTAVWITIDKDVLAPADATTNWDQGEMPLAALLQALQRIGGARQVVGVDVCGDYAPPRFRNPLKRVAARFDHPATAEPGDLDLERNARTNGLLLATLREIAA